MTVLITGASSPLGRLLVDWLRISSGGETIVATAKRDAVGYGLRACDVRDRGQLSEIIEEVRPRLIYHLAAQYSGMLEPDIAVNTLSARTLLELLTLYKMPSRVVLIGSAAEYGIVPPDENPVRETRALAPVSVYGLTKAFQTLLANYFAREQGSDVVVARVFNLIIPEMSERLFVGRAQRMIAAVKQGKQSRFNVGNVDAVRDYVCADQALRQLCAIAERGTTGEVYHVASGIPTRIRDLLNRLLQEADLDWSVVEAAPARTLRGGIDVPVIYGDIGKTSALMPEGCGL